MGHLRPGHREPEPARLHRHVPRRLPDRRRRRTGRPRSCPASSRAPTSTRSTPRSRSSIENIKNNYARRARPSGASSTCLPQLNRRHRPSAAAGPQPRGPHPVVRAGLPHADGGQPTPSTSAASRSTCSTLYGPGTQARQILIARRLIERGVRFVQVWHGKGQPWDNHDDLEVNHRKLGRRVRPGHRRAARRPEAARPARRDAGHLGRRVRPHARRSSCRKAGRQRRARSTAATTTTRASPSGWPAAASRAARSTARPTSSASRPSRTRSTSTTCTPRSCTCWASTTSGSPTATPAATSA